MAGSGDPLKIALMLDGSIVIDGKPSSMSELRSALGRHKGEVWYHHEGIDVDEVDKISNLLIESGLEVKICGREEIFGYGPDGSPGPEVEDDGEEVEPPKTDPTIGVMETQVVKIVVLAVLFIGCALFIKWHGGLFSWTGLKLWGPLMLLLFALAGAMAYFYAG